MSPCITYDGRAKRIKFLLEGKETTISRHKAITHALDPEDNLFGILQRFTTFRGYLTVDTMGGGSMSKPKLCPNAIKDSLTSACKTDVDHTLGYYFDSCFVLHRCHHAVNIWLHQMRLSAGHWGNPYHNLAYTEDIDTHRRPNFLQRLPPTLKPKTQIVSYIFPKLMWDRLKIVIPKAFTPRIGNAYRFRSHV